MNLIKSFSFTFFLFLTACAGSGVKMTPLEIQSMQTRQYENEYAVVFSSTISVLQDLGYTVTNASKDTGLIAAESASESDTFSKIMLNQTSVSKTKATAFIEEIGSSTKIRLNFVNSNKTSSMYGQTNEEDEAVLDPQIYQNAFDKIENAIFVRASAK
ncbi:hypothetical protein FJM67_13925 [Maribrevibacterium harenarium]|uniref:DUF4136 domain-containing protein n=1 Tax=Maribrevibacterium harenarium TaxID=2589817 RepID=A0A501WQ51_9GAMM|nr:hypothetical protein [Maribrevibacterium harenarium]TPE47906.1 hypothetical protein FJM67_13925 [Maribrevibacterium harenarium]